MKQATAAMASAKAQRGRRLPPMTKQERRNFRIGFLFISPLLFKILVFVAYPMIFSFIMSFHEWNIINDPVFVGFDNYKFMFEVDPYIFTSLKVTLTYTAIQTPLGIMYTLFIAVLLNTKIKNRSLYRTLFYLPSIVPAVASSALWILIFNPNSGLLNAVLGWFGIEEQMWLLSKDQVLGCLIGMSLWGAGGGIVVNLATLQGVPTHLYESMELDGANAWQRFWKLTIPMISPVLLYHFVTHLIGNLQAFNSAYLMTGGGPDNGSLFYMLHLYRNAFLWGKMGYACAMAWVLFAIIAVLSLLLFYVGSKKVYYEGA